MTANAASSALTTFDLEFEDETVNESAARENEEFLANLAYTMQNAQDNVYLAPDEETVPVLPIPLVARSTTSSTATCPLTSNP